MRQAGKRILALALCLTLTLTLPGGARAEEDAPQTGGALSYTQVIPPAFEDVGPVSEGFAAVYSQGKWGYVDTRGEMLVAPQHDLAYPFREGLAVVGDVAARGQGQAYQYGFVDRQGRYTPFTDPATGMPCAAAPEDGGAGALLFRQGFVLLPGNRLGTAQGRMLPSALTPTGPMGNGLAPGYDPAKGGGWGYLDQAGETALYWGQDQWDYFGEARTGPLGERVRSYRYLSALLPFDQGLAPAWQTTYQAATERESSLLGFLDPFGRWAIPPAYTGYKTAEGEAWSLFCDGLAVVRRSDGWGAVDLQGRTAIPFQYQMLEPSSEGLLIFRQEGAFGLLTGGGAVAVPAEYDKIAPLRGGIAAVEWAGERGLIDRYGTRLDLPEALAGADLSRRSYDGGTSWLWTREGGLYALGRLDYRPALPGAEEVDGWAYQEVCAAVAAGLVPIPLLWGYRADISRADFCTLAIQTLCTLEDTGREALVLDRTGKDLYTWMAQYPFRDATQGDVIAAYALGIVTGRGGGRFDPAAPITRQEAAAFLARTAALLGVDTAASPAGYADGDQIGDWFTQSVDFVTQAGIMGGGGANRFNPLGRYTREQSYVTVFRLFQALRAPDVDPEEGGDPTQEPAPETQEPAPPEPSGFPQPEA